jgi:hypothetical protein
MDNLGQVSLSRNQNRQPDALARELQTVASSAAEIAAVLGAKRSGPGQWMARCPCHRDRTPSLSIREGTNGTPLVHCFAGCTQREVIEALDRQGLWDRSRRSISKPAAPRRPVERRDDDAADQQRRIELARRLWHEGQDPRGTLAERYLTTRELDLDDDLAGRMLRFHPRCWFGSEHHPCLIAAFRPIVGDLDEDVPPAAILRIALTADGEKIGKKMLGPVAGAAIKVDPDESVSIGLGITEGMETGLAVRATGWRPVWAIGSAGAIEHFPVLAGVEHLTIFADHDETQTGARAAWQCAKRWRDAGQMVEIKMPKAPGCDWADEWGLR